MFKQGNVSEQNRNALNKSKEVWDIIQNEANRFGNSTIYFLET